MFGRTVKSYQALWVLIVAAIFIIQILAPISFAEPASDTARDRDEVLGNGALSQAYVPGEVIVKYKEGVGIKSAQVKSMVSSRGLQHARPLPNNSALLRNASDVQKNVVQLSRDPLVEYAQPNYIYKLLTNDPLYEWQWALVNKDTLGGTRAPDAWNKYDMQGDDVIVAVIDTGVDYNHPDLADKIWRDAGGNLGHNFLNDYNDPNDPMDDNGHGTHVAGIIAMVADNNEGGAGIAPGVEIMALKVGSSVGSFNTDAVLDAIDYAAANGAQVVNMSFGGYYFDQAVHDAIANHSNILFVAAAGNEAVDNDGNDPSYPASYDLPNIISVAALDSNGNLADFSNYGARSVDLAAPGEDIWSSIPVYDSQAGLALAISDPEYGSKAMFWGFGLEDLDDPSGGLSVNGAVYDSVVRTVYGFFGVSPSDTVDKPILVVDDDNDSYKDYYEGVDLGFSDVKSVYLNSLAEAGYECKYHEVPYGGNGPNANNKDYSAVIWFTGNSWSSDPEDEPLTSDPEAELLYPNLTAVDQNNLISYLQNGGNLFLSGRDATFGIETSAFYNNYLNADFATEYVDLFSGLTINGAGDSFTGLTYSFNNSALYTDLMLPNTSKAQVVFKHEPYASWPGTSMAVPYVAGGAAMAYSLYADRDLGATPEAVIALLKDHVTPLVSLDGKVASGGTLNVYDALAAVPQPAPTGGGGGGGGGVPPKPDPNKSELTATGEAQTFSALDERLTVTIPAGALQKGTKLTVRITGENPSGTPNGARGVGPVFSLETDRPLTQPVKVAFRYDEQAVSGIDPRMLVVFRYNEKTGSWDLVGGRLNRLEQTVVVELPSFSKYAVFAVNKTFNDISGHWAQKDIELLAARGIASGTSLAEFSPNVAITRVELAGMLVKSQGLKEITPAVPTFKDVSPNAWWQYGTVEAAAKAGLMVGSNGQFRPGDTITREELAAVAVRLAVTVENNTGAGTDVGELPFADAEKISRWAREVVATAYATGLMQGTSDTTFAPRQQVSRAEATALLVRLMDLQGLFEETVRLEGKLVHSNIEGSHYELETADGIFILLVDKDDRQMQQLLARYQDRQVKVTGIPITGHTTYMRGQTIKVTSLN